MKPATAVSLAVLLILVSAANAQIGDSTFGSKNTYSAFIAYSNDSSHIILGSAPNRKFASVGFQYECRLLSNRQFVWTYAAEFRPLIFESDPTATLTIAIVAPPPTITLFEPKAAALRCIAGQRIVSGTDPITGVHYSETILTSCGRRCTYVQGLSPAGTRINLLLIAGFNPLLVFLPAISFRRRRSHSTPQALSTSPSNSEEALSISSPNPAPSASNIKFSISQTHTLLSPIPELTTDSSS